MDVTLEPLLATVAAPVFAPRTKPTARACYVCESILGLQVGSSCSPGVVALGAINVVIRQIPSARGRPASVGSSSNGAGSVVYNICVTFSPQGRAPELKDKCREPESAFQVRCQFVLVYMGALNVE